MAGLSLALEGAIGVSVRPARLLHVLGWREDASAALIKMVMKVKRKKYGVDRAMVASHDFNNGGREGEKEGMLM